MCLHKIHPDTQMDKEYAMMYTLTLSAFQSLYDIYLVY